MRFPRAGVVTAALVTCFVAGGMQSALASGDPVVWPGHLHGWNLATNKTESPLYTGASHNPASTASYKFRYGPGRPPVGKGSLLMAVGDAPNSRVAAVPPGLDDRGLDALRSLSYATYLTSVGSSPLPIDFKISLESARLGHFTTLVYEPRTQSSPKPAAHEWQTWHATSGEWWATRVTGECSQSQPCSWSHLKSLVGDDSMMYGAYFELGDSGSTSEGTACALDKVDLNGTIYNMEVRPPRHPHQPTPPRPKKDFCRATVYPVRTTAAC